MQKVQIGGNRLGSGGKQEIELRSYERSTHDLGYIWRSSMAPGTLVPFMVEIGLPGDTFDIDLQADVKTHPTLGPLFGSFKLQLDVFEAPVRLFHNALMQNTTALGNNMVSVLLPTIVSDPIGVTVPGNIGAPPDNFQINSSSILAYLGIRGWGLNTVSGTPTRQMNAIPLLMYWECYKNYYSNKQELNGYYLVPPVAGNQDITGITIDGVTLPQNGTTPPGQYLTPSSAMLIQFTGTGPTLSQVLFNTQAGQMPASTLGSWSLAGTTYTLRLGSFIGNLWILGWSYADPSKTINVTSFPLTNLDAMRTALMQATPTARYQITSSANAPFGPTLLLANTTATQNGLGLKTYQSDILQNWLNAAWYLNIHNTTLVSTAGNAFSIDALILARKVYDLLNRIALSGGTYQDWINAAYDHEPYSVCNTPIYHGGLSKEVIFQEVVSTAQQTNQPLGTLAGKGGMSHKHKGGKIRIKCHEVSYLMGIVSLTPRIDYSQGNAWHTYGLLTMDDFHKPGLDQIGFQQLITEQMAWWDTQYNGSAFTQASPGYQPAWLNYMTNFNKTYGNFAVQNNEMFMTLNRRYQMNPANGHILDMTTYIDPSHYNFIFAQTNLDAQNFWVQIAIDNIARRKMSAKIMPNL